MVSAIKTSLLVLVVVLALGANPAAGNLVVETGPLANTSIITAQMFKKGKIIVNYNHISSI